MIKILLMMLITINLYGFTTVNQNMKALYKGVDLTEVQEDYILDNQDKNLETLNKVLKKEIKKLKIKYINDKNVAEFIFNSDGTIGKIKFLKRSDKRKIDKATKRVIKKSISKMNKPEENTPMRFIFIYKVGQSTYASSSNTSQNNSTSQRKEYYQTISNGTTKFQYKSEEYTRVFETSKDGFINMTQEPRSCAKRVTILTESGQKFTEATGNIFSTINKEAPKGKYKILIQTKKDCNINLQYQ